MFLKRSDNSYNTNNNKTQILWKYAFHIQLLFSSPSKSKWHKYAYIPSATLSIEQILLI